MRWAARADPKRSSGVTLPPGARVVERVGGGDINEAFRVVLADGRDAFVKTRPDAARHEDAAGLGGLAEPGALRTPAVLDVGASYLALEWIAPAPRGGLDAAGAEELGRGLARTHLAGAPVFGAPAGAGTGEAAGFGSLRLSNEPTVDWPTFY